MSKNTTLLFSALGHAYFHMFTAFYFVIVLSLELEWRQPYHELVNLWTPGALLVGVFALAAGYLGDRWSARGMLVVYFWGMGLASVAAGFASTPLTLLLALSALGLFAAIYHPVGIPLVIRNAGDKQGMALAVNGVFGSGGAAMAGVVTGYLADAGGSFLAFVLPGVIVTVTGAVMLGMLMLRTVGSGGGVVGTVTTHVMSRVFGRRGDRKRATATVSRAMHNRRQPKARWLARSSPPPSPSSPIASPSAPSPSSVSPSSPLLSPLTVLLFCLTAAGLIYHATQTVMPKAFSTALAGADLKTVGIYVALVYLVGGAFQFVGGALADRFELKRVYLAQFAAHGVLLLAAASVSGVWLVAVLAAAVALGAGVLPAENMLLARYTPSRHHGLVFGLKFVLFFGTGPLGVVLVAFVARVTGAFVGVFVALGLTAAVVCAAALVLPRRTPAAPLAVTTAP